MDFAIELYNEPGVFAAEVGDVALNRALPSELQPQELPIAQSYPESLLPRGLLSPQLPPSLLVRPDRPHATYSTRTLRRGPPSPGVGDRRGGRGGQGVRALTPAAAAGACRSSPGTAWRRPGCRGACRRARRRRRGRRWSPAGRALRT